MTGTTTVPISIDPFFVHIFFEEQEEREREREERRGLDRVRVRDLRYEKKLGIGELEFSLDDGARLPHEAKRDFRNLLRRVLDDLNEDDDHGRHDEEHPGRHHK